MTSPMSKRLAGDNSHYTVGLLNEKGKVTPYTWSFPSVTHILDVVAKPALYRWYFTEGISGVAQIFQKYGDKTPSDVKSLMSLLKKHNLGPIAIRDAKANLGHQLHDDLESLAKGKPVEVTTLNASIHSWFNHAVGSVSNVIATEQPLVSFKHQIAGTVDIIYRNEQDGVVLADLKTGSTVPTTAFLQIAAYRMMWEEMGGAKATVEHPSIDATAIIHCPVSKNAAKGVAVWSRESRPWLGEDRFLKVLEMYRALEGEKL